MDKKDPRGHAHGPKAFAEQHQQGRALLEHYTGQTNYVDVSVPGMDNDFVLLSRDPKAFPNIYERQEILTKVILNVGLQIVLENFLKARRNYETIQQAGLLKPGTEWKNVVACLDAAMRENDSRTGFKPTDRLNKAVSHLGVKRVSDALKQHRFLATSTDLLAQIPPGDAVPFVPIDPEHSAPGVNPVMESFHARRARYNFVWDEYKRQQIAYIRQYSEWMASGSRDDPEHALTKPVEPEAPDPERPVDPRIERFNALFGKYLRIYETGPKMWESSAGKLLDSVDPPMWAAAFADASSLRDANRITLFPAQYKQVDRVLELLSKHNNTLLEPPKLAPSGHFDQKAYFDIREVVDGKLSEKTGPIAEIKIEAEHLHNADRRSHPVYKCMQRMDRLMCGANLGLEERKTIFAEYEKLARRFSTSEQLYQPKAFSLENFLEPVGPARCHRELQKLNQSIYAAALATAPENWQAQYIEEALKINETMREIQPEREAFHEDMLMRINPELFERVKAHFLATRAAAKPGRVRE